MVEFLAIAAALFSLGFGSILALKFKIPPLVIFLLVGVAIGTFNQFGNNVLIGFLGDLGSSLLLFAIGTEFSIYKLVQSDFKKATSIAVLEIVIVFLLLFFAFSHWFVTTVALLLALAFSVTSTAITLKLLQELHLSLKFNIPLIVNISVVEDLIAVFVYTILSSFALLKGQPLSSIIVSFSASIILFTVAYYLFYKVFTKFIYRYAIREEDLLILALGVLLLFVSISEVLNLSTAFGAYIAGSVVSMWKGKWKSLEKDLAIFSYVFIAFFFFTTGLRVNIFNIDFGLLLLILPLVIIVKLLGVFTGSMSTTRLFKLSLFNSLAMLPKGELSLVIVTAAVADSLLPDTFLGLTSFLVFFSTIITYILLRYTDDIYSFFYSTPKLGRSRS